LFSGSHLCSDVLQALASLHFLSEVKVTFLYQSWWDLANATEGSKEIETRGRQHTIMTAIVESQPGSLKDTGVSVQPDSSANGVTSPGHKDEGGTPHPNSCKTSQVRLLHFENYISQYDISFDATQSHRY
jgi:hypothetical protein